MPRNIHRNQASSSIPFSSRKQALFHILPVPYEATVSYGKGTAKGPAAILAAFRQVEPFDGDSFPCKAGIYADKPASVRGRSGEEVLKRIEDSVRRALAGGRIPVVLGGEHTVTAGAVRAVRSRCNRFGVVHFDAHDDLRDSYMGAKYSHACVMHRVLDLGVPVFQIGVRSYCQESKRIRKEHGVGHLDARAIAETGIPRNILPAGFPGNIYISFDIDALDASLVPATGTPEPGGLMWFDAIKALRNTIRGRRVLGFDVVELAPIPRLHASDYTAARLVYAIMGIILRDGAKAPPA